MRTLRRICNFPFFLRAREGVTAIEFAIIAPVMLLLMFSVIEFGLIFFIASAMESATNITSRLGKTGYADADAGLDREQTILAKLAQTTGGLVNPDSVVITSMSYGTLGDIDQEGTGTAGYGSAGDIVVYTVTYPWVIITPVMSSIIGTNGIYQITARMVVKNEPYN